MPKKKRESTAEDHLSSALRSLRERPDPEVGLDSDERITALSYVLGVGADAHATSGGAGGKQRIGFNLPAELCERVRNAVWHLADRLAVNLSSLTEDALTVVIVRLEREFNDGKPFPQRKGRLKGGALRVPARGR